MATAFEGWGPSGEEAWITMKDDCEVLVRKWAAAPGQRRGVVHICHGISEHSARYGHLASFLAQEGYTVYCPDQRAHGKTAERAQTKGELDHSFGHAAGSNAINKIVEDHEVLCEGELRDPANANLPFFVFGHSLGSVIATFVASKPGVSTNVRGLVLSGCPARLPGVMNAAFGPLLTVLRCVYGGNGVAPLIAKLTFEKWNAKFAPNATDDDWINSDPVEVQKYLDDPLCGFKCSVDFMTGVRDAMTAVGSMDTLQKLPRNLPVVVMVGADDACGVTDFGKRSAQQVVEEFARAERRAPKLVVYGEMRHELSNELCREEFASDLVSFLNVCVQHGRRTPHSRL
mmetsp:Transcript_111089/g.313394  ORF Transcript_111089/g.313394 Transcript_111089/m.313394 type:complete len:344 (+) Transcript_111089:167-1198(+)